MAVPTSQQEVARRLRLTADLLGSGGFAKVLKGILDGTSVVAIKVDLGLARFLLGLRLGTRESRPGRAMAQRHAPAPIAPQMLLPHYAAGPRDSFARK